jgi:hypothetical protein
MAGSVRTAPADAAGAACGPPVRTAAVAGWSAAPDGIGISPAGSVQNVSFWPEAVMSRVRWQR